MQEPPHSPMIPATPLWIAASIALSPDVASTSRRVPSGSTNVIFGMRGLPIQLN
jgi:hypothetical protein